MRSRGSEASASKALADSIVREQHPPSEDVDYLIQFARMRVVRVQGMSLKKTVPGQTGSLEVF